MESPRSESRPSPAEGPATRAREIVRRVPRLASLLATTASACRLAQDENTETSDLTRALSRDPELCAQLLKVANSASYGQRSAIDSVERAAVVLGRKALQNVALAAGMHAVLHKIEPGKAGAASLLWRHALRTAAAASEIARARRVWDPSAAFAAGLMHDIGLVIELVLGVAPSFQDLGRDDGESPGPGLLQLERRRLGTSHDHLGAALCDVWGFSGTLRDTIAFHHDPLGAGTRNGGRARVHAAVVHVADVLNGATEHGISASPGPAAIDPEILAVIGLAPEDVDELARRAKDAADEVEATFG